METHENSPNIDYILGVFIYFIFCMDIYLKSPILFLNRCYDSNNF